MKYFRNMRESDLSLLKVGDIVHKVETNDVGETITVPFTVIKNDRKSKKVTFKGKDTEIMYVISDVSNLLIPCSREDKEKDNLIRSLIPLTREIIDTLVHGDVIYMLTGNVMNLNKFKVNGKLRTWKRNKDKFELPIKYGLYEYGKLTEENLQCFFIIGGK